MMDPSNRIDPDEVLPPKDAKLQDELAALLSDKEREEDAILEREEMARNAKALSSQLSSRAQQQKKARSIPVAPVRRAGPRGGRR